MGGDCSPGGRHRRPSRPVEQPGRDRQPPRGGAAPSESLTWRVIYRTTFDAWAAWEPDGDRSLALLEWIVGLADGLPDDAVYVPDRLVWRAVAPTGHRVEMRPVPGPGAAGPGRGGDPLTGRVGPPGGSGAGGSGRAVQAGSGASRRQAWSAPAWRPSRVSGPAAPGLRHTVVGVSSVDPSARTVMRRESCRWPSQSTRR